MHKILDSFITYEGIGNLIVFEAVTTEDVFMGTLAQVEDECDEHAESHDYDPNGYPFHFVTIEAEGRPWQRGDYTWIVDCIADVLGLDKTVHKQE